MEAYAGQRATTWFRRERVSTPAMHPILLDAAYAAGLLVGLPYLVAAGRGGRVAEHVRRRFRASPRRSGDRPCLWIHGVSVGEILSAAPFLARFEAAFPRWEVVLSATTSAGLEAGRRRYGARTIFSYPFDLSATVRRSFDRVRPDLVVIVEHELWPNFLWHAEQRGVPVALVNGRLSSGSFRGYRLLSRLLRWPPRALRLYCVEDQTSAARYRALGVDPSAIRVTGNIKFDVATEPQHGLRARLGLDDADWVFVGASLHRGEERPVIDAFRSLRVRDPGARLVLAPRRLDRLDEVLGLVRRHGLRPRLWSRAGERENGRRDASGAWDVLVVDTFGDLQRLVWLGDAVFVGGSLIPFGGHNPIEPASAGRPVIIGPHHESFSGVVSRFLGNDALLVAGSALELGERLRALRSSHDLARSLVARARETIAAESGASVRTVEALRPLVDAIERRRRPARESLPRPPVSRELRGAHAPHACSASLSARDASTIR